MSSLEIEDSMVTVIIFLPSNFLWEPGMVTITPVLENLRQGDYSRIYVKFFPIRKGRKNTGQHGFLDIGGYIKLCRGLHGLCTLIDGIKNHPKFYYKYQAYSISRRITSITFFMVQKDPVRATPMFLPARILSFGIESTSYQLGAVLVKNPVQKWGVEPCLSPPAISQWRNN